MTRFVLFSHGRSGTNFVMNNLRARPEVRAFMEPFHQDNGARSDVDGQVWHIGQSSADFARDVIWTGEKPVEGFKLFYFHCREDAVSSDIWPALQQDREVKIIFINRRNLLMKHLSDLRAEASGVWHPTAKNYLRQQYGDVVDLKVDIGRLHLDMLEMYCAYHRVAGIFANHSCLHLTYEDFAAQGPVSFRKVQRFLGLVPQPPVDRFKPGTLSPQTTRIVNAEAVRKAVARSIFADFLIDCPLL